MKHYSDLLSRVEIRYDHVKTLMANHVITDAGCWEYQGCIHPSGYGRVVIYCPYLKPKKRQYIASRVAYAFFEGVDPAGKYVCHKCDNPACINPDHLYLGTARENTADMFKRGREHARAGEYNAGSKLTEPAVLAIVAKIRAGLNNKQIADQLPVSHHQVSLIRLGKSWGNVLERIGYDPEQYRRFTRKSA